MRQVSNLRLVGHSHPCYRLHYSLYGTPGGTRTRTYLIRSQARYPLTPRRLVPLAGLEPAPYALGGRRASVAPQRLEASTGIEPASSGLQPVTLPLGHEAWYSRVDSNHRHLGCRPSALAAELLELGIVEGSRTPTPLRALATQASVSASSTTTTGTLVGTRTRTSAFAGLRGFHFHHEDLVAPPGLEPRPTV